MNKKQAASFLQQVIQELFQHGWAEDYQPHMDYNGQNCPDLFEVIVDGGDVNAFIDRVTWDEEGDWRYDDGGLSSFAISVTKLMRKFQIIEGKKEAIETKMRENTSHSYKCPHCGRVNTCWANSKSETCGSCDNPVKITKEGL